ncbi:MULTISPECIES: hypothetical protein [unclassified Rhizobium]|uniref:hypothetical protein n=1 Tax=unclassified Rhizobium TaxID=2613769 RepID=UPI0011608CD7|nr:MULTISPECIES: hypothetical protein [unclassified Rhizobium]TQX86913.1 hypothetical protein EQW76_17455 [Rhizobium sp. rho-13.1]TQY08692.1 hypothetical protein EQW74_23435 [Rhizobium sp. rho-1.1]
MFSSDQLAVPSLVDDILFNPNFSLTSWMIPRAPYVFPDALVFFLLRLLFTDNYLAVVAQLLLHVALIFLAARLVLKRAILEVSRATFAWYIFLGLSMSILAVAQSGFAGQHFDASMPIQLFLPITHGTAAACAVLSFCLYERVIESRSLLLRAVFLFWCTLAIFSDKLFIVFFAFPYFFCVLLATPNLEGVKRAFAFTVNVGLAFALVIYLDNLFTQQTIDPLSFPIKARLGVIIDLFKRTPIASIIMFSLSIPAFYVGIKLLLSLPKREANFIDQRRAQGFIVLMTGAGLSVGLLLWQTPNSAYSRYMVGMQMGGLLASALLISSWRRRILISFLLWMAVSMAAIVVALNLRPESALGPFAERKRITDGLRECRERFGLQAGYAQYWQARKISVMTEWEFQINQFEPDFPVPFFWGNNLSWFYYRLASGQQLVSNFIIDDALPKSEIFRMYGVPSVQADCGGLHVLVYNDATELQRRVQKIITDRYALKDLTRNFPPDFSPVGWALGVYQLAQVPRQTGELDQDSIVAKSPQDNAGFVMYGPYLKLPSGRYSVEYSYSCSNNASPNTFEITAELGSRALQRVQLQAYDPSCNGTLQHLALKFDLDKETANIEFRAFFGGSGTFELEEVRLDAGEK